MSSLNVLTVYICFWSSSSDLAISCKPSVYGRCEIFIFVVHCSYFVFSLCSCSVSAIKQIHNRYYSRRHVLPLLTAQHSCCSLLTLLRFSVQPSHYVLSLIMAAFITKSYVNSRTLKVQHGVKFKTGIFTDRREAETEEKFQYVSFTSSNDSNSKWQWQ